MSLLPAPANTMSQVLALMDYDTVVTLIFLLMLIPVAVTEIIKKNYGLMR